MLFVGKDSLIELKNAVVDAVKSALNSMKNEEEQVLTLTSTINNLKKELKTTKDDLEDIKSKKKIELMEIEHLVKMKEEKNAIELEKKVIAMQKEFNDKEMKLLKEGHEQTMMLVNETKKEFKELYTEIINRLPNVNMEIKKG